MERITRANILAPGIDWLLARPLCPLRYWSLTPQASLIRRTLALKKALIIESRTKKLLSDLRSLIRIRKCCDHPTFSNTKTLFFYLNCTNSTYCRNAVWERIAKGIIPVPSSKHTHTFRIAWSKLLLLLRLLTSCTLALFTKHFTTQKQEPAFVDIHNDSKISICKSSVDAESWVTQGAQVTLGECREQKQWPVLVRVLLSPILTS